MLRGPDGTDVQYGRIPPAGAQLRFSRYRVGGGAKGNVGRNTLTVLKSSIPYVAAVSNRYSAKGGIDAETPSKRSSGPQRPAIKRRGDHRRRLRALRPRRERPGVPSHTLAAGMPGGQAGSVTLLIVPKVHVTRAPVGDDELAIGRRLEEDIRDYLEPRRPLTVELAIAAPEYMRVGIEVGTGEAWRIGRGCRGGGQRELLPLPPSGQPAS